MPDHDWWQALWPDPEKVLRAIGIEPGMSVLDLCCGDGWFTLPLARVTGARVYALDLDPAMLERARAAAARQGLATIDWILGDAREVSALMPETVDYALIANTFHGVDEPCGLARAVASILKPDGAFAIVNWHARPREETPVLGVPRGPSSALRMTPEALRAVVEPAGFHLSRLHELPPYHYAAVFGLERPNQEEEKAP
jgi:ubiquinone/menaquinone biosynthesis C-methylase UbiE